jgi:hypothetical protein
MWSYVARQLFANGRHRRFARRLILCVGGAPSPPAEKANARQDQAGQASTCDGAGDRYGKSEIIKGLYVSWENIVIVKPDVCRRKLIAHECRGLRGIAFHEG